MKRYHTYYYEPLHISEVWIIRIRRKGIALILPLLSILAGVAIGGGIG